jgi:glycosidase
MPLDLVKVDPKFGSQQDLISLVDTAHSLGLKVLFDCVIHGFSPDSPLLRSTPEAFIRNPDGSFARHPIWNSVSTDWASEQYLDHIRKVVRYDCETYHIDGYRVDAASFKGPNWNRIDSYASGSRSPHVMTVMLQTLREYNPDSILLNEVFGPLFYSTSNLAHDNQCEAVPWLMRQMKLGNLNAEDYRKHLWYVWSMLPEGTDRVFYTRNHDTSWFAAFEAYDPMYFAFESIHAFCGVPSVFSGDPKHPPLPGESEWRLYRSIFQARKRLEGPLDLSFPSEIPQVFHGLRGQTPFYVSLGNEPLLVRAEGRYRDVLNQYFVNSKEGLLTVEPFQVLIRESR